VLPAAIDIIEIMLGKSYAKELQIIPFAHNTARRSICDISEGLSDQLLNQIKTSRSALQVDVAIDVVQDANLNTYVLHELENYVKETFLFWKPTDGRVTSLEVFHIINHLLQVNEINWKNCIGFRTDGAQSMFGINAELQALVTKKAPRIICTHCALHRQVFESIYLNKELQTVLQAVKQPIERKTLCNVT
jgi:hypothetical protein